jgi:hypothetical protein
MTSQRIWRVPAQSLLRLFNCAEHQNFKTDRIAQLARVPIEEVRYVASGLGYYNTGTFTGAQAAAIVRKLYGIESS